jgi:hypothetical protein
VSRRRAWNSTTWSRKADAVRRLERDQRPLEAAYQKVEGMYPMKGRPLELYVEARFQLGPDADAPEDAVHDHERPRLEAGQPVDYVAIRSLR